LESSPPIRISRGKRNPGNMSKIFLKKGREKAPAYGHPWVFSGAIERVEGAVDAGGIVDLFSHGGEFIGRGYYNPCSQIAVRLLARTRIEIDKAFFRDRIRSAADLRKPILSEETTACRMIHAEGDLLPGLICDRYGDYLVLQLNTAGMERFRDWICSILKDLLAPRMMYDRSDPETRAQEGLPDSTGPIAGVKGEAEAEAEGGSLASGSLASGSLASGPLVTGAGSSSAWTAKAHKISNPKKIIKTLFIRCASLAKEIIFFIPCLSINRIFFGFTTILNCCQVKSSLRRRGLASPSFRQ
jgi:hypothetical protein